MILPSVARLGLSGDVVDLGEYPCIKTEAIRRIRLILDEEVRRGVHSDLHRDMTISSVSGETLLMVPFRDALGELSRAN